MSSAGVTPLGRKIVAAILGTTLLALVLTFVLNLIPSIYGFRQTAADRAVAQAELMAASLVASVDFDDAAAARESLETLSLIPSVIGAAVYIDKDVPFAQYGLAPKRMAGADSLASFGLSELLVEVPIPADQAGSVVVISVSLGDQWTLLKWQVISGALIFLCVFLLSFKMAGLFRRRLGDPLGVLTEVVRDISRNKDYSRRVEHVSDDEIGLLVAEFNAMLGKIESRDGQLNRYRESLEDKVEDRTRQLLRNNRLLLAEIKKRAKAEMIREEVERINRHDLKSGLSLVIGYPELLLSEGGLDDRQSKHIKRIRAAGYRMLDMIRNQLDIFKMEKGIYTYSPAKVDVVEILCGLEEEFAPLTARTGVGISMKINGTEMVGDEMFMVDGDEPLLRTMLRNLIQNSIEASRSGDQVSIHLDDIEGTRISVANPAAVPAEIRRRFFEKYVTCDKENGTGLGTYFAALIAKTHGAHISLKTNEVMGTRVSVMFKDAKRRTSVQESPTLSLHS